jgi:glycosyltransferase involved in cell wall biosynthesis
MQFILFSEVSDQSIRGSLGRAEYSYYFVMRGILPVLRQMGEVIQVERPAEQVDPIYDACVARGEPCIFISCSPPNSVTLGLRCPTIVVFAWEFSTLPDGGWDPANPRNDWRYVLRQLGCAISLSSHTAQVVKNELGAAFPIFPICTPVWDRIARPATEPWSQRPTTTDRTLRIRGTMIDSAAQDLYPERIFEPGFPPPPELANLPEPHMTPVAETAPAVGDPHPGEGSPGADDRSAPPLRRHTLRYILAVTKRHGVEWYREAIRDLLPAPLRRAISRFGIFIERAYRSLTGRRPPAPASSPAPAPAAPTPTPSDAARRSEISVGYSGIVYMSVLNPSDGRKNWQDIVTAFCWAFRDTPDATLVLKMIRGDSTPYRHDLFIMLAQLAPFSCRIIAVDGFLEDEEYARMITGATYYVNASNAEGLCLPLMEAMALGKPAIAPRHTAMLDYIDASAAFLVGSSPEHNVWPNDPRQRFSTMRERIRWDTLVDAYRESYRVAKEDPERYLAMSRRAAEIIRDYSSDAAVRRRLEHALAVALEVYDHRRPATAASGEPAMMEAEAR